MSAWRRRVDRRDRLRRVLGAVPTRRAALSRRLDRQRRLEARALARGRPLRDAGARPRRPLHRRRAHDRGRAPVPARLRRRHELDLGQVAELVEGAAEVCGEAGCALMAARHAELPASTRGRARLRRACVGIVERERLIDGSRCAPGDVVLAAPLRPAHDRLLAGARLIGDGDFDADLLLAPHRLYLDEVEALQERADVKALAHVTGGGIVGNLARVLPEGGRRRSTGTRGSARPSSPGWTSRRRGGGAAPRLQPRDRDVRGRARG